MESYGAGWNDDDAPPPQPGRLSRLPQPATKRVAAAAVVVLVAGGGFWASHRVSGGPKVGDCATDQTTDAYSPNIGKAACTDPAAVWQVVAKTYFSGSCPAGDYVKLAALGGGGTGLDDQPAAKDALCLALHVQQGECLQIQIENFGAGTGSIHPREVDCRLGKGGDRYRITAIRTDTTDRGVCPKSALPFSYAQPREVICASVLA